MKPAPPASAPPVPGDAPAGRRVLLIDDSDLIHNLVAVWLKHEAVDLRSAMTAADGVASAKSFPPDLILLDVDLPDASGFDICRRLKDDPDTFNVPVVFLTGATATEEKIRGLDLGAVDYVTKPFHPAEFRARVRAALRTKELTDLLATRAQIDGLTGLRNRAYLDEQLAVARATLRRTGRPFGLVLIDVDHFKQINDAHGHPFGDEVLRRVAGAIAHTCRAEDVPCRHGGDEFAVLTPGVGAPGVVRLAERVWESAGALRLSRSGAAVPVGLSVGVADAADEASDASVVDRADAALYRAKQAGRNRVEVDGTADERRAA